MDYCEEPYINTLREKCPNTDQKNLRIWTLFMQWQFSDVDLILNQKMIGS